MQTTNSIETSAIGKITWRLVPFLGLMFFINFLDRTAIGFAGPNGMTQDLGLTAAQFGFASRSAAQKHVHALAEAGLIEHAAGHARGIRLATNERPDLLALPVPALESVGRAKPENGELFDK